MGKIEQNKRRKKEKILKNAYQLFLKKGIEKTSVSDITKSAGVAKGTFYLYFEDKYEIRDRLITHMASKLFTHASLALGEKALSSVEDKIIFIANNIIEQLKENKPLLMFITKNLSWGVFKEAISVLPDEEDVDFFLIYKNIIENSPSVSFKDPELMLFMIIELVSSTCYSTILYNDPVPIDKLLPYLNDTIRDIIARHKFVTA